MVARIWVHLAILWSLWTVASGSVDPPGAEGQNSTGARGRGKRAAQRTSGSFIFPMLIHQTVKNRSRLSCEEQELMDTWIELNPNYRYILWDDRDAHELVSRHYPRLLSLFDGFPTGVERADVFRYLVLNKWGGVYADTDVKCLKPIDQWNEANHHDAAIILGIEFNNEEEGFQVNNWAMASMPKHPVTARVIQEIRDYVVNEYFNIVRNGRLPPWHQYKADILKRTGPQALSRAVMKVLEASLAPLPKPLPEGLLWSTMLRVEPVRALSLGWAETCEQAVKKLPLGQQVDALACHQFFGSWKDQEFHRTFEKRSTMCVSRFINRGPTDAEL